MFALVDMFSDWLGTAFPPKKGFLFLKLVGLLTRANFCPLVQ